MSGLFKKKVGEKHIFKNRFGNWVKQVFSRGIEVVGGGGERGKKSIFLLYGFNQILKKNGNVYIYRTSQRSNPLSLLLETIQMKKSSVFGLSIILMVLMSGCITMSFDSKVNRNGEIVQYDIIIDTNSLVYGMLNSEMSEDGKTLRESVISKGGKYEEEWDGDDVKIIIKDIPPEDAYTEKTEKYLIYKDPILDLASDYENDEKDPFGINNAMDSAIKIHYYLEMPNEIIDSNADFVDGNKAEWHMVNVNSMRDVYAKCEVPFLPGISLFSSLCMLLIIASIKKR
ncbi:MAG: hypothetical protein PHV51_09980 [Methanosarcinaceae archaeon]|nr:hypothetical protein [Methanosarcinaceae archaeon]MDD4498456.1 hypothetical protein [Methanosarcinaceae archaeon]